MNPNKKLKIAFVGGAYDSAVGMTHKIASEMDEKFELIAGVFSRNNQKSLETARRYHLPLEKVYENIESLIKNEKYNLDAIAVMTPQDQHYEHVISCLNNDIPVICEKALVTSVDEAKKIKQKLEERKGYLAVIYNYTGYPMIRELRQLVINGKLGEIQQIHLEMPQEGFSKMDVNGQPIIPQDWRLKDQFIPTLSLDLGVHLHMMAYFLTQKNPLQVVSVSNSYGNFKEIIDNVSCLVKYEDGMMGCVNYGKTAFGSRNGLKVRIYGTLASAEWVQESPEYLNFADNKGNKFIIDRGSPGLEECIKGRYQRFKVGHPAGFIEAFANYYTDIADSIKLFQDNKKLDNEYVYGIDCSILGLSFLAAVAKSSRSNQWEKVE